MRNNLYRAIYKSVSGRLATYFVQFFSLAIYARMFTPEEFGIIASIQVFVVFFQLIADVGIGPAIINEKEFGVNKRNGVFTVTAILGCIVAALFYAFSFALNEFYDGYQYQEIAVFVCISIFFSSLNIVPLTAMNKDAKFIHISVVDIIVECMSLGLIYILYQNGLGLLSLASRPAIQSLFKFIFIFYLSEKTELGRSSFGKELFHIKSILGFSIYQFGFNFINYFSRNLDNILIAKYFGMTHVGIYDKAYQLMRYPLMLTTFAMNPAIQPILTKVRDNKILVILEHNLLTSRLLAISLPISLFIYVNSHSVVLFLFGEQWIKVVPLIEIFSFMIPIQAVSSSSGSFFQVMNKTKILFFAGSISATVNSAGIAIGIILGDVKYVAIALVIGFSLNFFQTYFILFKYCFCESPRVFYLQLVKVLGVMSGPLVLYFYINAYFLTNVAYSVFVDLLVNCLCGLVALALFSVPIKRILLTKPLIDKV
ncbi:MAG: O-antigen/teichoic acid export membrane protein [Psychromonas sp.]|jgi:O-antigen/teichoic acid export membrane protein|uniref:oligosaccharide flippase family protein n=1 Tax=Psychromonas sp. TaxID=1884585 RepID=UPI0039E4F11B